jgi:two-component system, OmpR family, phosphate regulon sensor histidine kinase PhoR
VQDIMVGAGTLLVLIVAGVVVLLLLLQTRRLRQALDVAQYERTQLRQAALLAASERDNAQRIRDAALQISTEPIVFIDPERRIRAVNAAAANLGLFAPGHSLIETTRSFELDLLAAEALSGAAELPREFMLNGQLFRARGARTQDGAVLALRDISELTRLGRARRDFITNISHELRTPLTAIHLLIGAMRTSSGLVTTQTGYLDQIESQTIALTQMTQELSDLAQIESGQLPMRMVSSDLRAIADGVIAQLEPQRLRAGLTMTNAIDAGMRALVDPVQLARVLSNLAHNAIKFTPSGGVTFSAARSIGDPEFVHIAVRDTGVGIAAEDLVRVFERFYKVDRARGQSGTGLGLAIARHIIEAHGGRIWAESMLGQGTTFFCSVPMDD